MDVNVRSLPPISVATEASNPPVSTEGFQPVNQKTPVSGCRETPEAPRLFTFFLFHLADSLALSLPTHS